MGTSAASVKTDFYTRSLSVATKPGLTAYDEYIDRLLPQFNQAGESGSPPEVTATAIYKAATDGTNKLRYPAGGNAGLILAMRKLLPTAWFIGLIRRGTKS